MLKIEIFIGSPRKNGNTSSLVEVFDKGLDKSKIVSEKSFLYDYKIKPCDDCRACKTGKMECIIPDDMKEIYSRIDKADIIIIGTPIYWFGPSAKTKLLLDRLRPYYTNKKLTGKKATLLLPAGTGATDCDLTIEMFKRSFDALGVELIGIVAAEAYDIGEASNDKNAMASINELILTINGLTSDY